MLCYLCFEMIDALMYSIRLNRDPSLIKGTKKKKLFKFNNRLNGIWRIISFN